MCINTTETNTIEEQISQLLISFKSSTLSYLNYVIDKYDMPIVEVNDAKIIGSKAYKLLNTVDINANIYKAAILKHFPLEKIPDDIEFINVMYSIANTLLLENSKDIVQEKLLLDINKGQ